MEFDRVVDLLFPETGNYGSGYLVTNQLVLTAKHVAGGVNQSCRVTPLQIRSTPSGQSYNAIVVWVSRNLDAALLELTSGDLVPGLYPQAHLGYGRIARNAQSHLCESIGFPEAQSSGHFNKDQILSGRLTSNIRSGLFQIDVDTAVPADANLWRGFSGSPVFVGDKVVGVIESYLTTYAGRVLTATPVDLLFDDETFRRCVSPIGDASNFLTDVVPVGKPFPSPKSAPALLAPLRAHLVDRRPQEDTVRTWLHRVLSGGSRRPAAYLIHGTINQCVDTFVDRLAQHTIPRALERHGVAGQPVEYQVSWPVCADEDERDVSLPSLIESLIERLQLTPGSDMATIFERLVRDGAPVLVSCELRPDVWAAADAALMREWLEWWEAFPDMPEARPLLIVHFIPYILEWPVAPITALRVRRVVRDFDHQVRKTRQDPGLTLATLSKLKNVALTDVIAWAHDYLPERSPDDLRHNLAPKFRRMLGLREASAPMRVVVEELQRICQTVTS